MTLDPRTTMTGHVRSVACPTCGAGTGDPCRPLIGGTPAGASFHHVARRRLANLAAAQDRTTP